jgi:hypothetical protein
MHIEIGSRVYEVSSSAIALPGETQLLYSVSLLPVARADAADQATVARRLVEHSPGSPPDKVGKRRELK